MRLALALLVATALLSMGCHRGRGRTVASSVPRTLGRVAQQTVLDGDCDHVDQVLHVAPGVVQVRACGRRREYVMPPGRRPVPRPITEIETRAAIDLACNGGHLVVESPAPAVRAVSGCGRRARYDLLCARARCEWTMTAHGGRWAGLLPEVQVPPQFEREWALPEGVGPTGSSSGAAAADVDLGSVPLPPPPGATSDTPPDATSGVDDVPIPPPPP